MGSETTFQSFRKVVSDPTKVLSLHSAKWSPTPKASLTLLRCSALRIAFDREERIRQRDRRQVRGQLRVDDEHDGHPPRLAGSQRLTCKAEAVELAEILCGVARAVARDCLPGHRMIRGIDDLEHDLRHFARVN